MGSVTDVIGSCNERLSAQLTGALSADALRAATDDELIGVLSSAAELVRRAESAIIEATALLQDRSSTQVKAERATTKAGCGSMRELLQRSTLASYRRVRQYESAARVVRREVSITSGELLPAAYPLLREALADGSVGGDALDHALAPVQAAEPRLTHEARHLIDLTLAAGARGVLPDDLEHGATGDDAGELPDSAEGLKTRAQLLVAMLDHDGVEPRERAAARRRGLVIGAERDGLVPVRGHLLPEVGAQLRLIVDAINNPKSRGPRFVPTAMFAGADIPSTAGTTGSGGAGTSDAGSIGLGSLGSGSAGSEVTGPDAAETNAARAAHSRDEVGDLVVADERTRQQQVHDAFANALTVLAGTGELPQIGGAAPTLVVSVSAESLEAGDGAAHVQGSSQPVSLHVARRIACTGRVQRVVQGENGRVLELSVIDRVFNAHQRRAILLRDGGCVIPGCDVPSAWCEIHHVTEYAQGGPTHTDNGVVVCWHHHRMLAEDGWEIRMNAGAPEVRAPERWDPHRRWRPVRNPRGRPWGDPHREAG